MKYLKLSISFAKDDGEESMIFDSENFNIYGVMKGFALG